MNHNIKIKTAKEYDLVVCGGGFTGVACAYQASLLGLKVAIVESRGNLGGVGTSAYVPILLGGIDYNFENNKYNFIVGGFFKRMYYDLRKTNACINLYEINRKESPHGWYGGLANSIIFDVEKMKILLDKYLIDNNVDIMYFTNVVDVKLSNDEIDYVLCSNKSGFHALSAKAFADCTGDADVAVLSNCEFKLGRDKDHLMAPASLIMVVENVDTKLYIDTIKKNNSPRFKEKIKELRKKGIWKFPYDILISIELNKSKVHILNTIRQVGIDGTDTASLTKGMINGRKENDELFNILKEYFPGFENAYISQTAEMIGIRETRRIIGEYILSMEDLLEGKIFNDTICLSSYYFDLPDPKKPSFQPISDEKYIIKNKYTQIPYRTMLPKQISNLICPGRAISVEREVLGPIRVMGPCVGMGQAAGIASYVMIKDNVSYKNANIGKILDLLKANECIINNDDIIEVEKI